MLDKHEKVKDAYYAQSWPCELCGRVSLWRVWIKLRPTHFCRDCYHRMFPNGRFTDAIIPEAADEKSGTASK